MIDTYFLYLEERLIHCIYNVSGSMRVDTVCIVSIVSGAEADTMYLQCICSLSACIYHLSRGITFSRKSGGREKREASLQSSERRLLGGPVGARRNGARSTDDKGPQRPNACGHQAAGCPEASPNSQRKDDWREAGDMGVGGVTGRVCQYLGRRG